MKGLLFLSLTSLIYRSYGDCIDALDESSCNTQPLGSSEEGECCIWDSSTSYPFCTHSLDINDCPVMTTSTAAATTGSTEGFTTTCYCDTTTTLTPAPSKAPTHASKDKGPSYGVGDCECKDGMIEIRYIYLGTEQNVDIVTYYDTGLSKPICSFHGVNTNDEITCNILLAVLDNNGDPVYSKYAKETPFVITYQNGETCSAKYHTSCSQNIVGIIQPECEDIIVSGWRDKADDYNNCDDGMTPCDCNSNEVQPDDHEFVDLIVGEYCYCASTTNLTPAPVAPSKIKKSQQGSAGVGDCDCDGGMIELRLLWSGDTTVNIEFYHKDGDLICTASDTVQGQEVSCNVNDYTVNGDPVFEKLGTNTYVKVVGVSDSSNDCMTEVHTSCSRDIVGTNGLGNCGTNILVTGWKDGSDDYNDCDDGLALCSCENGTYVEEVPDPYEEPVVEISYDVCFCSNRGETANITSLSQLTSTSTLAPAGSKAAKSRNRDNGYGFGDCDCDGGMQLLRFVYKGDVTADAITVFYDELDGDVLCEYSDIERGNELTCDLADVLDTNGDPLYDKMKTNTYVRVETSNGICEGSWHTSCSRDILGWTADGCPDVVVSGWSDGDSDGEDCDDGFEPCDCNTDPCTLVDPDYCGGVGSEECILDEGTFECVNIYYQGNNANLMARWLSVLMVGIGFVMFV